MIKAVTLKITDVPDSLARQFYRCSYKEDGTLYSIFENEKEVKNNKCKITYCTYNNLFAGWGMLYHVEDFQQIMLYVHKKYRRKGIGTTIVKTLAGKKKLKEFFFHQDDTNIEFFKKLDI